MKVAILLTGEYRTFSVCRKTMKFLDDPNADIYFSTWDKTIYSNVKLNLHVEEVVTEERILLDLGMPFAKCNIEPWDLITTGRYNTKMIHRILRGLELIWDSGVQYDYILILRPDLFFNVHTRVLDYNRYIDAMGFAWLPPPGKPELNDPLFVGSYKMIQTFYNALLNNNWNTGQIPNWHVWWYYFIYKISPAIHGVPEANGCVFCRMWTSPTSTFEDAVRIHDDWRDLRLLQQKDQCGENWIGHPDLEPFYEPAKEKWNNGYYDMYKCPQVKN